MSSFSSSFDLCSAHSEDYDEFMEEIRLEEGEKRQNDEKRPQKFLSYFENQKNNENSIFNLPGVEFVKYSHKKIKFTFRPSRVADLVSARIVFVVSLKYRVRFWMVNHDYLPVNCKWNVYNIFFAEHRGTRYFRYGDDSVPDAICEIWRILYNWAQRDSDLREEKFCRYFMNEDVYIDEDDEELFLSEIEVEELKRKRDEIWKRMLPPPPKHSTIRTRRRLQ
ncbi:hypothetical protein FQA39_LY11054 [Lamprigera yunnana]|nr:hypothetical protein FQA39_LY11054 [Lamprigera yunnana]